jgi:hypothetical protein
MSTLFGGKPFGYRQAYYPDIHIEVDVDYAMDIKYDLMQDGRLTINQNKTSRAATFTTSHERYEAENIRIEPSDGSHYQWQQSDVKRSLLNQIRGTAKVQQIREPTYNLTFNLAAFDTILGALEKRPHPGIEKQIMEALLPAAEHAPHMFFDKLIHRLPPDVQLEYIFRIDDFLKKNEDEDEF